MVTSPNSSGEENEPSLDSEFHLQPINAQTPSDFYCEESSAKLPLTDQEHQQIARITQRKQRWSFSLRELFGLMTTVSLLMALWSYLPFNLYVFSLGVVSVLALCGVFNKLILEKHRVAILGALLIAYLLSATWLIYMGPSW